MWTQPEKAPLGKRLAATNQQNAAGSLDARSAPYAHLAKLRSGPPERGALSKIRQLLRIIIPGTAKGLMLLVSAIGMRTLCHELHSYVVGMLYEAMITRNVGLFARFSAINVAVDMTAAVVEESTTYLQNLLSNEWYANLTKYTAVRLFKNNSFYTLRNLDKRVKDPDQRLTVEVQDTASEFAAILAHAITPFVDVAWFSWRLYTLVKAKGMRDFYLYVALSAFVVKNLMPDHQTLDSEEKKQESRFRFIHNRLHNQRHNRLLPHRLNNQLHSPHQPNNQQRSPVLNRQHNQLLPNSRLASL